MMVKCYCGEKMVSSLLAAAGVAQFCGTGKVLK